jgi:Kef-type K+ transport system membrane component KefB
MEFLQLINNLPGTLLIDIAILIIVATIIAFITRFFKQPLIPAYIITGLVLGPLGFKLINDTETIHAISEFGIAFLLFIVGLELNLKRLKHVGPVVLIGGVLQVILTYLFGQMIAVRLGFAPFEAVLMGLVLAFSSTMVVIKLLSDKDEMDTLHGKIILGILLMQDILVILALSLLMSAGTITSVPALIANSLIYGGVLLLIAAVISKFIFPRIFAFAAKNQELLFLASITSLFLFAIIAELLHFSITIGAFIAGLAMANLPYRTDIIGKIKPLKTFFATIFFVSLGMQLNITFSLALLKIAAILFAAIFIVKPLIIYLITTLFGYEKRTAFLAGLSLGQVSEFSLIMISLPFVMGNISTETFSLVILLASVSMAVTAYLIEFKEQIYTFFEPILTFISKILPIKQKKLHYQTRETKYSVVLIGKHRMGSVLFDSLNSLRKKVMVVDYNPDIIKSMINKRETCMYGDIATKEVLENLNLKQVKILISTVPSEKDSLYLINNVKQKNKKTKIFVTSNHLHQAKKLYKAGADYVILPQLLSGEKVSLLLKKVLKDTKYSKKLKEKHSDYISKLL